MIAIFVDGCFWHACPKCYVEPKSNKDYWLTKIERNVRRDSKISEHLIEGGWKVIRFWEHEIMDDPQACRRKIENAIED